MSNLRFFALVKLLRRVFYRFEANPFSLKTLGKELVVGLLVLLIFLQSNLVVLAEAKNKINIDNRAFLTERQRLDFGLNGKEKKGNFDSEIKGGNATPYKTETVVKKSQPAYFGENNELISLLPDKVKNFFNDKNKELLKYIRTWDKDENTGNALPENIEHRTRIEEENTLGHNLVDDVIYAFARKRFNRVNGPPNNYRETFSMPENCVNGTYKIRVVNGEQNGTKRISSGFIKLNGIEIISENDFNQNIYVIEREVALSDQNTLDIRLASTPGSYLTIEVYGENCGGVADAVPPHIVITSPTDNTATRNDSITLSGTAEDLGESASGIAGVSVNNTQASYDTATKQWQLQNVSLNQGTNQFVAKAIDNAGNESTTQVTVIRDLTAPVVNIISPTDSSITTAETVSVSGSFSDPGTDASGVVAVTVNGNSAEIDTLNSTWIYNDLPLTIGANTISVQVTDNAENNSTNSITVTRNLLDNQPPVVTILNPTDGFSTFDTEIQVSGTAFDQGAGATGIASVSVNGGQASYNPANGQWTANVTLSEGINTITAIAADNASPANQSESQIQINRVRSETPTIVLTSPENGTFTSASTITVAGTVSSNNPYMSLTVTVNGQNAAVSGGQFSQTIAINEGLNTITAVVTDTLGQQSQTSTTVTSDRTPPTVSLSVPDRVQPGSTYQIRAEAADAYGVADVEFLIDGVSMARTPASPYEFNYLVPPLPPNQTVTITAIARDLTGASATATAATITTGPSGLVGFVFDDVTGYILPGAAVSLNNQTSVFSNEAGRYDFISPTNSGFIRLSKDNYIPVERNYNALAGLGVELFDSRLTPVDSRANTMNANGGGLAQNSDGHLIIQFPENSFAGGTDVRLTEISQQGLINLLPFGWSPVPGAVIDVRPVNSQILTPFQTAAGLMINQVSNIDSTVLLTLVRYDESQHRWIVIGKDIVAENGNLTAALPSAGQYAFLAPDSGATAPPQQVTGQPLTSSAPASSDALNGATAAASSSPRSAVYSPTAKSTVSFQADSAAKLPSGVSIEATFDESYTLLIDRTTTLFGRPSQDFVLYSFPYASVEIPNRLGASFIAKPTRTDFGLADLLNAKIHVEIFTGRMGQSGVLIGQTGGTVRTDEGGEIEIPANSTNEQQSVFFRRVAVEQTGVSLPAGYETIAAFDLTQTGSELTQSAKISFPTLSGDNSKIVVAKVVDAGGQKIAKVVARAVESENNRTVSTVSAPTVPGGLDLEGIRSSGRYIFIRVPHAFGYVTGTVLRAGVPNGGNNVKVSSNQEPFGDVTKSDAKFILLGKAGTSNTLGATAIGSDAVGQSSVNLSVQDEVVSTTINLATVPLQVEAVAPANNSTNVIVTSPVTITFNKPISGATITGSNFKLSTSNGNPVITNLTALAGGRSVVLTPANTLQGSTAYKVQISQAVRDIYGNSLSSAFESAFSTTNIVTAQQRLKPQNIIIGYPSAEGISTVTIPAGSVPEGSVITVINRTNGSTVSTVAGTSAISLQIPANVGDEIEILIRQPDGVEYTVRQSAFKRADGFYSVGANGGVVASDDGTVLLNVPASAISGQANIKIYKAIESEITAPRTGEMAPSEMAFAGGVKVEVSGNFTNSQELHLELDAPASILEGQKVMFMSPRQIEYDNQPLEVWETITSGKVEAGKIKSNSPPFLGVTLPAAIVGVTLLQFWVFIPRRLFVVRGKVQQANAQGLPTALPNIYCAVHREGNPVIVAKSGTDGSFAVADPTFQGSGQVTVIASKNGVSQLSVAVPYQSTEPSLFGFETRWATVEFPADSPINQPANIQIEANTLNLPDGQPDPIAAGKATVGSQIKFRVKTTPNVENFAGNLFTNGSQANIPWQRTREQGYDIYETTVSVDVPARYEVRINTQTSSSNPNTISTKSFNFIGIESPTNLPPLPGPPFVTAVTPRDLSRQVDVGTKIHLEFSEPVTNLRPGENVYLLEAGNETPINGEITSNDLPVNVNSEVSQIDFRPINRLKGGKTYTVVVKNTVKDTDAGDQKPLDQNPAEEGNQDFTSTFETFQGVIISDNPTQHGGFRIAAIEDLLVATELNGTNGTLKVYDTSSPERLTLSGSNFISNYPVGLGVAKDNFNHYSQNRIIQKIAVVSAAPVPFTDSNLDRPYSVQIYGLDNPQNPVLIGIVTLNTPRASTETPASINIHNKKAFIGSTTKQGVTVIDLEEAINAFLDRVAPNGQYSIEEKGRVLQEALIPNGQGFAKQTVKQIAPYRLNTDTYAPVWNLSTITQSVNGTLAPVSYIASAKPQLISLNLDASRNGILNFYDGNGDGSDDRVLVRKDTVPLSLIADLKAVSGLVIQAVTKDLVVAVGGNNFWIFDVSNPNTPFQIQRKSFVEFGLSPEDSAQRIEVEGTLAYVLFSNKVAVIDFSDPSNPYLSTVISGLGNNLRWFTVSDGFIYTLDAAEGIKASIGRGIAQVLAYGHDPTEPDNICGTAVVIDRENRHPQQPVGFFVQVYGQQATNDIKVKIRKVTISGNSTNEQIIKTVTGGSLIQHSQNVVAGRALWDANLETFNAEENAIYTAEVVLDEGKSTELRSRQVEIPFSYLIASPQTLDFGVTKTDQNTQGIIGYLLSSGANVSIEVDGAEQRIIKANSNLPPDSSRAFGIHNDIVQLVTEKQDGKYPAKLKAILKANPTFTDEVEGFVTVGAVNTRVRQPGSTVVSGVEVGTGNLALSVNDLTIKGRGLSLEVSRHYNSQSSGGFNSLGYGWRHNYQISLVRSTGEEITQTIYSLIGGEGGGQTFKRLSTGNEPIKADEPYQGTLVPNDDGSFDYFTKNRIKYHFIGVMELTSPRVSMGNIGYIEEPNGNRITFSYDSQGRMSRVTDSSGRSLTYTYELANTPFAGSVPSDPNGASCTNKNRLKQLLQQIDQANINKAWRITEIKSSDGIRFVYEYDDNGNLQFARRDGNDTIGSSVTSDLVWKYEYNPSSSGDEKYDHLIKTVEHPNNSSQTLRKTYYEYDLTKNFIIPVKKITMQEGVVNEFNNTYTASEKIEQSEITDGKGNTSEYFINADGNVTKVIDPRGGNKFFLWTRFGQIEQVTDAEGMITRYGFDLNNNPISQTVTGGDISISTVTAFDPIYNKPIKTIDGNGNETNYALDAKGNVRSILLPTGRTITINYYANGDVSDVMDEYGFVTRYNYDNYGNPTKITKEAGSQIIVTTNTYDSRSRLKTSSDTLAPSVVNKYDALDRLVEQTVTDPTGFQDSVQITAEYLPEGQQTSMTRSGGGQSYEISNKYDGLNRLTQTTETVSGYGAPFIRIFTYDQNSNLLTSQDRRGVTTTNEYDALNYLTKVTVSGSFGAAKIVWDASEAGDIDKVGNVRRFRDLYGNVTTQDYDSIYRLRSRQVSNFPAESFGYDNNGNTISHTDRNGRQTTVGYDQVNRQTRVTDAKGRQKITEFRDAEKKVIVRQVPQGLTQTTAFDGMMRPVSQDVKLGTESASYLTAFEYTGRTVRITDPRGNVTIRENTAWGQAANVSVEGANPAYQTATRYTAFGAVKSHTDANNRNFNFTVDGFNRARSANYNGEFSESWSFDGEGLLENHTDKRGATTAMTYDNLKRALETSITKDETIRVSKTDYFDEESKEVFTDALDRETTQIYDGLRRVVTVTNAVGDSRTLTYDGENLRSETDWFNNAERITGYEYDAVDRPTKITQRQGAEGSGGQSRLTVIAYDDAGGLTKTTTDRRGNKQRVITDALGRLKGVYTSPAPGAEATERIAEYIYDGNSNRTAMTDGVGNTMNYLYDKLNRVETVNRAGGLQIETYTYDAEGNVKTYLDGRGGAESYTYDSLDRVKSAKDGANNETKFSYDGEGLLLEKTDPKGAAYKTSYSYNTLGSLKSVTDANNQTWNFTYDAAQNLDTVTDPLQRTVDYDYDALDRLTKVTQPLGLVTTYNEYDKNSNLKRMTDPKGQTVEYTYDELDRLKTAGYKNSQAGSAQLSYTYGYDAEDNLTDVRETDINGLTKTYTRKYDARNRLTEETDPFLKKTEFGYDAANNVTRIKNYSYMNSGGTAKETSYSYDALNRLDTVSAGSGQVAKYNWTADGLLDQVVYQGNASTKRKFTYDNADRVTNITNTIGSNSESFDYVYDANSNRQTETRKFNDQTKRQISYSYDLLDRLQTADYIMPPADSTPPPINSSRQVTEFKKSYAYEYDAVGNRNRETTQDTTSTITLTTDGQGNTTTSRVDNPAQAEETVAEFDDLNRLTKTTKGATVKDFEYDNNGNLLTEKINNAVVRSYEYDNRNQLRKVKAATGQEIARYDYDFERRRLSKLIQGIQIDYSYAGNQIVAEYTGNQLTNSYTLGANEVVKAELSNEGERLYYSDALGSVTSLSQTTTLTARNEYGSFSEIISNSGATYNSIGYTGQWLDAESGLMPLGNGERYYSPELGRFIQQDSLIGLLEVPQSLNRYAYTVNNPLKHTDPTGHIAPLIVIGIVAAVAGAGLGGAYSYEMQNAEIADGLRKPEDFSWGEVAKSAAIGAAAGILGTAAAAIAPAAIPVMIAGGFITSGSQIIKGHYESEAGYKNVGYVEQKYGVIGTILSFIGARSAYKGSSSKPNGAPKVLEESPTAIKTQPKQLSDGGVQERINSGRLLNAAPDEVVNPPKQTRFIADENGGVSDLQTGGRGNLNTVPKVQEPISLTSNGLPPRPPNSPNYSVAFRAKLKEGIDYPGKSEETHFQESNKQLHEAMKDNPEFGKQIEQEYPGLKEAISPGARGAYPRKPPTEQGLTWHHHAEEKGIMELIPREQHRAPGPLQEILHPHQKGGMENWGGGRKRNK